MSIFSLISRLGSSGFGYASKAEDVTLGVSLAGKTILVTGCNSGLGLETMRVLALRGAQVIGTARTETKATQAAQSVNGKAIGLTCELEDPTSIGKCIAAIKAAGYKLDAIIANAGIMALPNLELVHGIERQFFTNHIGHFMLVTGLMGSLAANARVVMLSSSAHKMAPAGGIDFDNLDGKKGYKPWTFYGQSKMANLLFAKELARRFSGTQKMAYAVHPGVISTNLGRHMNPVIGTIFNVAGPLFLKSIPEGAATECFCAANPKAISLNGNYFADSNVASCHVEANDPALAAKLWDVSDKIASRLG